MLSEIIRVLRVYQATLAESAGKRPLPPGAQRLLDEHQRRLQRPEVAALQQAASRLPASTYRERIVQAVTTNPVVIVCGETGCGKTTQVPQFLLDAALATLGPAASVLVTQPRRLAATAVAEHVARERGDRIGRRRDEGPDVVTRVYSLALPSNF